MSEVLSVGLGTFIFAWLPQMFCGEATTIVVGPSLDDDCVVLIMSTVCRLPPGSYGSEKLSEY